MTLARSKTGVCQTFVLRPETLKTLNGLRQEREQLILRLAKRSRFRSDGGHVLIAKSSQPRGGCAVAKRFRNLCAKVDVPCYGFYRLRHCASTAMSRIAMPHVQRQFMRHKQLQQQVTYTHMPDREVNEAVMKAREKLLGDTRVGEETDCGCSN